MSGAGPWKPKLRCGEQSHLGGCPRICVGPSKLDRQARMRRVTARAEAEVMRSPLLRRPLLIGRGVHEPLLELEACLERPVHGAGGGDAHYALPLLVAEPGGEPDGHLEAPGLGLVV